MWRDAASVRIKLKVSATQRHHRERAARTCCLAISQVRFLYGLPTYASKYIIKIQCDVLQWTRRNTIGRRSTCVRMKCQAFPLWLQRQSSIFLSYVRFSYQF